MKLFKNHNMIPLKAQILRRTFQSISFYNFFLCSKIHDPKGNINKTNPIFHASKTTGHIRNGTNMPQLNIPNILLKICKSKLSGHKAIFPE